MQVSVGACRGSEAGEGGGKHHLEPVHMVWVIQRDFLLGKSALEAVNAALAPVPNPSHDRSIEQVRPSPPPLAPPQHNQPAVEPVHRDTHVSAVLRPVRAELWQLAELHPFHPYISSAPGAVQVNTIRSSLAALSSGASAVGLPQPHLNRTALCDLPDSALEPVYLARRDDLRAHLHATARPKALRGAPLDGAGLADLVEALVAALNDQEFPTAGSMLEAFNQRLVMEVADAHAEALRRLPLPVAEVRPPPVVCGTYGVAQQGCAMRGRE